MPYQIKNTRNQTIATVADTTVDTTTLDLDLIGKNYAAYGIVQNQNFVALLENFANTSAPTGPIEGQCWYDITLKQLNIYTADGWKNVGSSTASSTQPTAAVTGDLWYDTDSAGKQLYVYNGSAWELVGPAYSAEQGFSGQKITTLVDSQYPLTPDYVVVEFYVAGALSAIFSASPEFTPSPAIAGFATIKPGFNLNSTITNIKYNGTATNADSLGGVTSANFLRRDVNDSTQGSLTINSNAGVTVGATNTASLLVLGDTVVLRSNTNNKNLELRANVGGTSATVLTVDAISGRATVNANPTQALGIATKQYVDNQTGSSLSLSNINNSTISGSTLTSGNITISTISDSTVSNSSVVLSTLSNVAITNSTYSFGNVSNANVNASTISSSTLTDTTVTFSNLSNSVASEFSISNSTVTSTSMSGITFTGANNTAPTALGNTNSNQIATTAFVQLQKNSPVFSGVPTAPTAAPGTNTSQIATTAFVTNAVGDPTSYATKQYVDSQVGSSLNSSSINNSTLSGSTLTNGNVVTSSIRNSTVSNSSVVSTTLSNVAITNSTYSFGNISSANVSSSTISASTVSGSTVTGATVTLSSLNNSVASNLSISNSTVSSVIMSSITFTGDNNTAPTAVINSNSNQIATTAFVQLQKNSPTFAGVPTAPTAAPGTSTTQLATTAFVTNAVGSIDVSAKANSSISIISGTGLTGGGDLTANRTIAIANTGVTAGVYGLAGTNTSWRVPVFTVNAQGQITTASSWAVPTSSNAYGSRTVSTAAPSGGVDGDIWLQV